MQNFTKEQAKSATETTTANRGYWGYQEMTAEEIQLTTGAGCGGCGGCGGGDQAGLLCNVVGGVSGAVIGLATDNVVTGIVGGAIVQEACERLTADSGEGGRSEG